MPSVLLEDTVTVYGGKASSILSDIGKGVPDASMRSTSYLFSLHIFTQSVHRYFDIRDSSGWESACIYISARKLSEVMGEVIIIVPFSEEVIVTL